MSLLVFFTNSSRANLRVGTNTIEIIVTPGDRVSQTKTYTININRAPVPVTVGYEFTHYVSTKEMGSVTYCTTISEPDSGAPAPFTLQSSIEGGTAIVGVGYIDAGDMLLEFDTGDNRQCDTINFGDVPSIGYNIFLSLTLVSSDPSIAVSLSREQIGILVEGDDATLRELSLSGATALNPAFASSTLTYSADVAHSITSLDISAVVNDMGGLSVPGASQETPPATYEVRVNGASSGNTVNLVVGANVVEIIVTPGGVRSQTETYTININRETPNTPPVANAGSAQTVNEGDSVTLNGTGSTDNIAIESYGWSSEIPTLTLTNADADTANFTAPEVDISGLEIILTLTVTDTAGLTDSATVLITVNNVLDTEAPVASAGDTQTVNEGDTVTLDAGLSTDNVAIDSYGWSSEIATLTLTNADAEVASFTAPEVEEAGLEIILTLTVTDAAGFTDSATVLITVNNVDREAPVAIAGEPQTVNEGDSVTLNGTGSTDNIAIESYGWSSEIPTLTLTNADADTANFTAPEVDISGLEIILTLTVTDTAGLTDSATVLITVNNVLDTEVPVASAGDTQTVNEGDTVTLDAGLSTDNIAIESYGWSSEIPTLTLTNADTDTASFTAPEVDISGLEIILTLTVTDAAGLTDSATVLITVNNVDREAPVAIAGDTQTVNEGDSVTLNGSLSTDNVAIDSYGWSSEIPTLTLTNADAEVASFTAPEVDISGLEIILTLTVTDTAGLTDSATVLITVNNVDREAPVASAGDTQTVNEGATVRLDGSLSTDNVGIDSYGWSSEIPTLTLTNADTDTANFIAPEVEEAGLEIILTLTVTDTAGLTDSATVLITVNNVVAPISPNDFVTVWDITDANSELTFPGFGEYTINWGDGSASDAVSNPGGSSPPSHTYAGAGTRTVTVSKNRCAIRSYTFSFE